MSTRGIDDRSYQNDIDQIVNNTKLPKREKIRVLKALIGFTDSKAAKQWMSRNGSLFVETPGLSKNIENIYSAWAYEEQSFGTFVFGKTLGMLGFGGDPRNERKKQVDSDLAKALDVVQSMEDQANVDAGVPVERKRIREEETVPTKQTASVSVQTDEPAVEETKRVSEKEVTPPPAAVVETVPKAVVVPPQVADIPKVAPEIPVVSDAEKDLSARQRDVEKERKTITELRERIAELEKLKAVILEKDKIISERDTKIVELTRDVDSKNTEIQQVTQIQERERKIHGNDGDRIRELEEKLTKITEERDKLIQEKDTVTQERDGARKDLEEARRRIATLEIRVRDLEAENKALREENARLQAERGAAAAQRDAARAAEKSARDAERAAREAEQKAKDEAELAKQHQTKGTPSRASKR